MSLGAKRNIGASTRWSLPSALPNSLRAMAGVLADGNECIAAGVVAGSAAAGMRAAGVPGIHFYTMNQAAATTEIIRRLKLG